MTMTHQGDSEPTTVATDDLPGLLDAARLVVDHLCAHSPIPYWALTRGHGQGAEAVVVAAHDRRGHEAAPSFVDLDELAVWSAGIIAGRREAVVIDPNTAMTAVGRPVQDRDGEVFGVLCGLFGGPVSTLPPHLLDTIDVHAHLLGSVLTYELAASGAARHADELTEVMLRDELTGLLNRGGWNRMIEAEAARSRRSGNGFTVAVIDMDGLKTTNDRFGHAAGDRKLVSLANALVAISRAGDWAARLGGDEFALYAADTAAGDAPRIVDRIRRELEAQGVGASIGAVDSGDAPDPVEAWRLADFAMYADKRTRRGR